MTIGLRAARPAVTVDLRLGRPSMERRSGGEPGAEKEAQQPWALSYAQASLAVRRPAPRARLERLTSRSTPRLMDAEEEPGVPAASPIVTA